MKLLEERRAEETAADQKLTQLAKEGINWRAREVYEGEGDATQG